MKKFKEITNINKAIKYLERNVCQVDLIQGLKWSISDQGEHLGNFKDDKELIEYANEQYKVISNDADEDYKASLQQDEQRYENQHK